jgi:Ca2+/Na+ antiporter
MARVLGETARHVTEQSIKKFKRQIIVIVLASFFLALVIGFLLGLIFNKQPYLWITILIFIMAILIVVLIFRFTDRVSERLERERINYRKGATGEVLVGYILKSLPDDYRVIHDLTTPFGNIDHVVVGPSGAYVIDTKNWKGVVTADGKGELLLNGKPTDKPAARNLYRTIMSIKEKIKVLSALDPYVRGVLVFTSARVEANWGETGSVYCVRDEKLHDYIVEKKKRLNKKEIDAISQAFLALARMDKDFAPDSK